MGYSLLFDFPKGDPYRHRTHESLDLNAKIVVENNVSYLYDG
jgi:hypothetical protein